MSERSCLAHALHWPKRSSGRPRWDKESGSGRPRPALPSAGRGGSVSHNGEASQSQKETISPCCYFFSPENRAVIPQLNLQKRSRSASEKQRSGQLPPPPRAGPLTRARFHPASGPAALAAGPARRLRAPLGTGGPAAPGTLDTAAGRRVRGAGILPDSPAQLPNRRSGLPPRSRHRPAGAERSSCLADGPGPVPPPRLLHAPGDSREKKQNLG